MREIREYLMAIREAIDDPAVWDLLDELEIIVEDADPGDVIAGQMKNILVHVIKLKTYPFRDAKWQEEIEDSLRRVNRKNKMRGPKRGYHYSLDELKEISSDEWRRAVNIAAVVSRGRHTDRTIKEKITFEKAWSIIKDRLDRQPQMKRK